MTGSLFAFFIERFEFGMVKMKLWVVIALDGAVIEAVMVWRGCR